MTISETIAAFLCGLTRDTIPEPVRRKAEACLLNGYGIGLGGYATPYAPVARKAALAMDPAGDGGATLLGDGRKAGPGGAMLANSALFHGRAQEDTCGAAHLGAIVIPMLTALIESGRGAQANFVPALVAGYEAGGLFEELFAVDTTPAGFRASTIYGVIGAAAAAGRLLDLAPAEMAAALANAVSFSGGLLQSFTDGTDEWRYQVGVTARAGWTAAELAAAGSTSAPHAFEGPKGLIAAFARKELDPAAVRAKLGRDWQTLRVAFKPFPVCAFNQTPVISALELRKRLDPAKIATVEVFMNPYECGYAGMDSVGPFNSISGTLMSIPFCIALTLARGAPTMDAMQRYDDAEVNGLMTRIKLTPSPEIPVLSCRIDVALESGANLREDTKMRAEDYAYSFEQVSEMVRRIGREQALPDAAYDRLERFAADAAREPISLVTEAFAMLPERVKAA